MDPKPESQSNRIIKLQKDLENYRLYVTNVKNSFKRDYNDLKLQLTHKDFELYSLKQQLKNLQEKLIQREQEIKNLTTSLESLYGEDLTQQN